MCDVAKGVGSFSGKKIYHTKRGPVLNGNKTQKKTRTQKESFLLVLNLVKFNLYILLNMQ